MARSQLGDGLARTLKNLSALLNAAEIIFTELSFLLLSG